MAERRMFAKTIIDSDAFLEMPLTSQALYFHLSMRADDEGFINNPKKIARMIGAADDDLRVLASRKFIIPFESGIVVIKHWKIHNYIRRDRITPTVYEDERQQLTTKDNGAYTTCDGQVADKCQSSDSQMSAQVSLGKVSLGKVNERGRFTRPTLDEIRTYCAENGLAVNAERFMDYYDANGWKVGRNPMKDWKATCRNWAKRDKERETEKKAAVKSAVHNFDERNTDYDALIGGFNV